MGYKQDFIKGFDIPLPTPSDRVLGQAFGDGFIHHTRHSLLFNKERGLAFVTAHNIDGASMPSKQYTQRDFEFDPKIDADLQIGDERGYKDNPDHYQRGHLARRKSFSWGTTDQDIEDAKTAELESDYWSNIAPQERRMHVAWGKVEDWMMSLSLSPTSERRACLFQGPVFTEDDPEVVITQGHEPVKIPAGYWKIVAIRRGDELRAAGFLIWQRDYATPEPLKFAPVLEQVRLTTIEVLTGLKFSELRNSDALIFAAEKRLIEQARVTERAQNPSTLVRMRNTAMKALPRWTISSLSPDRPAQPSIIGGPEDIVI